MAADPYDRQAGAGHQPKDQVGVVVRNGPADDDRGAWDKNAQKQRVPAAEPIADVTPDQRANKES